MQFHTHLDLNVIAVDLDSTVSVLLELTAQMDAAASDRAPAALEIVLDRSGSMAGAPLNGAKTALLALLDRLDPRDRFGLVTFDDQARIAVAATQLTDKAAVRQAIQAIEPGGMTDLAAGYLTGLQQAREPRPLPAPRSYSSATGTPTAARPTRTSSVRSPTRPEPKA